MTTIYFDADLVEEERRERLFAGDIFVFSPSPASCELVALARSMLEAAFAPHDPREVHRQLGPEKVVAVLAEVKPSFIHHPECKRLIPAVLAEHGVDLESAYFDVPRLRSIYPSRFLSAGLAYAYHPHRDTWYSAPQCQLNWWLPVFPVQRANGMAFYPRNFAEPVPNTSDRFNYYLWNTCERPAAPRHVHSDPREQPRPLAPLDPLKVSCLPPPGGIILFSGAQLHETIENTTDVARYSIDFRTVDIGDLRARRGAPQVDCRCTGTMLRDYLHARDLSSLPDEVVAAYDDGTATPDKVLRFDGRFVGGAAD